MVEVVCRTPDTPSAVVDSAEVVSSHSVSGTPTLWRHSDSASEGSVSQESGDFVLLELGDCGDSVSLVTSGPVLMNCLLQELCLVLLCPVCCCPHILEENISFALENCYNFQFVCDI